MKIVESHADAGLSIRSTERPLFGRPAGAFGKTAFARFA
jgi:hypothetical protein